MQAPCVIPHGGCWATFDEGSATANSAERRIAGKKEILQSLTATALQRVAAGDATAVRDVLDLYGGLVWAVARRFSTNQSDAEDAVQEIFLDVWKSAPRYDPGLAGEATFIAMIARRRLIDRRRRASRRLDPVSASEAVMPSVESVGENRGAPEEAAMAASALSMLRPEQQQVLRLSILQGLPHESIAESTGLPLGTVKTHIRRGLIRIRQILQDARPGADAGGKGSRP